MYQKQTEGWWKHWDFFLLDLIALQLAFFLAEVFVLQLRNVHYHDIYRTEAFLLFLCVFVHAFLADPYKDVLRRNTSRECGRVLYSAAYMGIVNVLSLYFLHVAAFLSRYVLGLTWLLYVVLGTGGRILLKRLILYRRKAADRRSVMVVTSRDALAQVTECVKNTGIGTDAASGMRVFLAEEAAADAVAWANHNWVDEIYLYLPGDSKQGRELNRAFADMGITVHRLLETLEGPDAGSDQIVLERSGRDVLLTYAVRTVSLPELLLKRILDIIGGLVGCILTGLLFLVVGPLIYAASPGPVFFSQERVGRNGKPFRMYKFRSMVPDAERHKAELQKDNKSPDGYLFKVDDDPRIIGSEKRRKDGSPGGIGHFIRRTSIDEFPQFWNVLRGDMSLVGTRPPTMDEWAKYSPNHRARMATRPGITGMWQVSGRSDMMDFDEVVRLDMEYIRNWSLLLDVKLLAKTVLVAARGKGAA